MLWRIIRKNRCHLLQYIVDFSLPLTRQHKKGSLQIFKKRHFELYRHIFLQHLKPPMTQALKGRMRNDVVRLNMRCKVPVNVALLSIRKFLAQQVENFIFQ